MPQPMRYLSATISLAASQTMLPTTPPASAACVPSHAYRTWHGGRCQRDRRIARRKPQGLSPSGKAGLQWFQPNVLPLAAGHPIRQNEPT